MFSIWDTHIDIMNPTVSIIMPCFNAAAHLLQSIGGAQAYTFFNRVLITMNVGTSDGTLTWLQTRADRRLCIHIQPNQGISAARDTGLRLAQGEYSAFIKADDEPSNECGLYRGQHCEPYRATQALTP